MGYERSTSDKVCRDCGLLLPAGEYYSDKTSRDGLRGRCRSCDKERNASAPKYERSTDDKVCRACGLLLPAAMFSARRVNKDGLRNTCKGCDNWYGKTPGGRLYACNRHKKGCSLTLEELTTIIHLSLCAYCSGPLNESGTGMDRCDSRFGYTTDNAVPCCNQCNVEKGLMTAQEYTLVWMHRELNYTFDKPEDPWLSTSMARFIKKVGKHK